VAAAAVSHPFWSAADDYFAGVMRVASRLLRDAFFTPSTPAVLLFVFGVRRVLIAGEISRNSRPRVIKLALFFLKKKGSYIIHIFASEQRRFY